MISENEHVAGKSVIFDSAEIEELGSYKKLEGSLVLKVDSIDGEATLEIDLSRVTELGFKGRLKTQSISVPLSCGFVRS